MNALEEIKKQLKDFETILNFTEDPTEAIILWLKSWRLAKLFEIIMHWINQGFSKEKIKEELKLLYEAIDELKNQ